MKKIKIYYGVLAILIIYVVLFFIVRTFIFPQYGFLVELDLHDKDTCQYLLSFTCNEGSKSLKLSNAAIIKGLDATLYLKASIIDLNVNEFFDFADSKYLEDNDLSKCEWPKVIKWKPTKKMKFCRGWRKANGTMQLAVYKTSENHCFIYIHSLGNDDGCFPSDFWSMISKCIVAPSG